MCGLAALLTSCKGTSSWAKWPVLERLRRWYARVGQALKHLQLFWFLEWDVVWTGNIVSVLDAYHPDATKRVVRCPSRRFQPAAAPAAGRTRCRAPRIHPTLYAQIRLRWPHRHVRDRLAVELHIQVRDGNFALEPAVVGPESEKRSMFAEMRAPSRRRLVRRRWQCSSLVSASRRRRAICRLRDDPLHLSRHEVGQVY